MSTRPIEIVGGGLAGLALGSALQRAGIRTTIFEAGDYPRHRVCGEFITGLDAATIRTLQLAPALDGALRHRDVAWFAGAMRPRIQSLPAPALGISRYVLDERLARAYTEAGGTLQTGTRVADGEAGEGRVFAIGRRRGRSPWLGLKVHVRGLSLERDLELHLGDGAYVGLARVDGDWTNVCGLFRRRTIGPTDAQGVLLAYLRAAGLGELALRLVAAEFDPSSFCSVAALQFDRQTTANDRLMIGDACAMIPPFTGNGMAMAFQSAATVLPVLASYARDEMTWPAAVREANARLRRRFRVRLTTATLLHPFLLEQPRQRALRFLGRVRLLPFRPLYALLH
jgi:2-polyprenyl-6-methoxyphenol hydroxylase-like FAD-dependent oxidoreductase